MRKAWMAAAALAALGASTQAQLVVGSDNAEHGLWVYDSEGRGWMNFLQGPGTAAWGVAADEENENLYVNDGVLLYRIPYLTLTPTLVGPILPGGHMAGLAWAEGALIGVRNIAPEGIFVIDPETGTTEELFLVDEAFNFGGLDYDPVSGMIYATSDGVVLQGPGLYRINPNTQVISCVRIYPKFKGKGTMADVDGLAIDDQRNAYLVVDEPGDVCVLKIGVSAYQTPFSTPFMASEIYSGAAWAPRLLRRLTCDIDLTGSSVESDPTYGHPDYKVDSEDFFYYLEQWSNGNAAVADLTHTESNDDPGYGVPNGIIDQADWMYFLDMFNSGCK